jgi:hypothetical protein
MSELFTCTSADPYDRHTYEIVLKNGKNQFFEHWEDVQRYWFQNHQIPNFLDVVIVKDKKKSKQKVKGGGFAQ